MIAMKDRTDFTESEIREKIAHHEQELAAWKELEGQVRKEEKRRRGTAGKGKDR